jgi:GH15 family glucan-1,4-alpha-glucosidase
VSLFEETLDHWEKWTQHLNLPFDFQVTITRSAITLKLLEFEETGAVVSALTTSVPEQPYTSRTWDYRLCWLRDVMAVLKAFHNLNDSALLTSHLRFTSRVVALSQSQRDVDSSPYPANAARLQSFYGINMEIDLDERELSHLRGYQGHGPVRIGNRAFMDDQHDVYGSVIAAMVPFFVDVRLFDADKAPKLFAKLEKLGMG